HRRQPLRRAQIGDLHEASLPCPAGVLADGVWQMRRAPTVEVIAPARLTSRPGAHAGITGRRQPAGGTPRLGSSGPAADSCVGELPRIADPARSAGTGL